MSEEAVACGPWSLRVRTSSAAAIMSRRESRSAIPERLKVAAYATVSDSLQTDHRKSLRHESNTCKQRSNELGRPTTSTKTPKYKGAWSLVAGSANLGGAPRKEACLGSEVRL
eukprot:scaffold113652_cov60-Phaeocystis_antarctica.AAC.2